MKYFPTIGLEIHVQLKTDSKMFCRCSSTVFGESPNSHTCPVCLGLPGALPVINAEAMRLALLAGEALHSTHPKTTKFDRKNYFYPDLPKGYQITQFDEPLNQRGYVVVGGKKIGITRAHLEEDTGKLIHSGNKTLVDFNRSGMPLLEIVSEPEINSPAEAKSFAQKIQQLLRYARVSEADMEKGSLRIDANVSVKPEGAGKLGTKVEIKNMNSFKALEKALSYESSRQIKELEQGGEITQETRGWDEGRGVTVSQRGKEDSHDYRYFSEPDLPTMELSQHTTKGSLVLPEMPDEKKERLQRQLDLKEDLAEVLTFDYRVADLFERSISELAKLSGYQVNSAEFQMLAGRFGNMFRRDVLSFINSGIIKIEKIEAAQLAELFHLLDKGRLSATNLYQVALESFQRGVMPRVIVEEKGLEVVSNLTSLSKIARAVINEHKGPVTEYHQGKEQVFSFLLGQMMQQTKGQANPTVARQVLEDALKQK